MNSNELKEVLNAELIQAADACELTSFESDTRKDLKGAAFFAFSGENFDGHDYLSLAAEKGAKVLLVSKADAKGPENVTILKVDDTIRAWQQTAKHLLKQQDLQRIGVTGSSGKTSTNAILSALLNFFYPEQVLSTLGNTNNHIGVAQNIFRLKESDKCVSLEMGTNHPGEIGVLSKIVEPNVAILTTVGASHIGNFTGIEAILEEKVDIFRYMDRSGTAIVPYDLLEAVKATGALEGLKYLTFGDDEKADFFLKKVTIGQEGSEFTVRGPQGKLYELKTNLSGVHQVKNICACMAALHSLDFELEVALKTVLANLILPGMRMRRESHEGVDYILDCYNANPQSTAAFLEWLFSVYTESSSPHYVVLGDMLELGHMSEKYHRELVELFSKLSQNKANFELLTVGEEYQKIDCPYKSFQTSEEAADFLRVKVKSGDTVLLKGSRGIRLETIYKSLTGES